MNTYKDIEKLIIEKPCDIERLKHGLEDSFLSQEEMAMLAVKAIDTADTSVLEGYDDRNPLKEFDNGYIRKVEDLPLLKELQVLLDNGLDPNTFLGEDDKCLLQVAQSWYLPYISATVMKLLLENGADPNMDIGNGETVYTECDGSIAIDVDLLPYDILPAFVQCWFVMTGYGGRPEKVPPFNLNPGHSFDELRNFKDYDYYIDYDQERKENMLHIMNRKTNEEIGYL